MMVLKIANSCFPLISVLPTQRTPHVSATTKLYFSQLQSVYLGIMHAVKRHYRKQVIQKTAAMTDAAQMKLDVLSAVHLIAEARRLITPTTSVVS
jgi:hypothetical protein